MNAAGAETGRNDDFRLGGYLTCDADVHMDDEGLGDEPSIDPDVLEVDSDNGGVGVDGLSLADLPFIDSADLEPLNGETDFHLSDAVASQAENARARLLFTLAGQHPEWSLARKLTFREADEFRYDTHVNVAYIPRDASCGEIFRILLVAFSPVRASTPRADSSAVTAGFSLASQGA